MSAEAVTRSAIQRKESRGAHTREDYKEKSEEFDTVNSVSRMGPDGEMQVTQETIPEMPAELKQIIEGSQVIVRFEIFYPVSTRSTLRLLKDKPKESILWQV